MYINIHKYIKYVYVYVYIYTHTHTYYGDTHTDTYYGEYLNYYCEECHTWAAVLTSESHLVYLA